ncbi:unnamed protein product [Lactuca saligna]|uniref:Uncharacterized protein n=1 Tax=Lactuca saligna TaxID=75948 RepID=A0AA36E9K6_LACSI|nr:unnamed protein product [Lactuca saligna]
MTDSLLADISKLPTTTFVMTGLRNFEFIGSIPKFMLEKIRVTKRGGKRKPKVAPSIGVIISKKIKKLVQKPRSPSPVIEDDSKERTGTEVQGMMFSEMMKKIQLILLNHSLLKHLSRYLLLNRLSFQTQAFLKT